MLLTTSMATPRADEKGLAAPTPWKTRAAAVAVITLVSACVPVSESYFEPSAPGGELESYVEHCGGPPQVIMFTPENFDWIKVRIQLLETKHPEWSPLLVRMTIQRWIPSDFDLFASTETRAQNAAAYTEKAHQAIDITADSASMRASWENGGHATLPIDFLDQNNRIVMTRFSENAMMRVVDFTGDWLLLEPPALTFDGVPLDLPPIRFARAEGTFIAPINC